MDEAEWLTAVVPHPMLGPVSGRAGERKLRLIVCAAARRLWRLTPDPRGLELLEATERYADGEMSWDDLIRFRDAAHTWAYCESGLDQLGFLRSRLTTRIGGWKSYLPWRSARTTLEFILNFSAALAGQARSRSPAPAGDPWDEEARAQADLLREIVGNPFRPSTPLADAVRRWHDHLIPRLARSIYDARRWADLPLLADALLDAGCADDALIGHCRDGGGHVPGCWAVDVILGRT